MAKLIEVYRQHAKTVHAETVGLLGWAAQVVNSADASITAAEWIGLATIVLIGGGVYASTNKTG